MPVWSVQFYKDKTDSSPKQNFVAPPTVRHGERSEAIQPRRDA